MIYLLRCEQDTDTLRAGWIKIGTTTRLSVRLKQIAAKIGHTPTVLAVLDGGFAEERALHGKFEFARQSGEWFYPYPELMLLIETEGRPWDGTDEVPLSVLGTPVRIDTDIVSMAKYIAVKECVTLSELVSRLLRPEVKQEFKKLDLE